jgi:acyl-CoA synthetase (AMP-forming)/AMP-acid ligase II
MLAAGGLWQLIEARAAATPEALFAVDEHDRRLDFAGYRDACLLAAGGLSSRGVGAGDVVSWQLPTRLEAMVLCGALARLGAVQNPILPIYRAREVGFVTKQSGAALLCVPGEFRGFDFEAMAREVAAGSEGLEVLVVDGGLPEGSTAELPPPPPTLAPDDTPVRWIFYTSGTTADPKGARHTDATLLAACRGMCERLALAEDDRIALVFPFTHVGGVMWLMNGLLTGAAQISIEVFDPPETIPLLAKHGATQLTAGTVFHQAYLAAQREHGAERLFPQARSFPGGGAPKPPQLHYDIRQEMGAPILSGYGLTECPVLAMNGVSDPDAKLAETEGRASPAETRIKVVKIAGGVAAPGEEGEIRVLAPQQCKGYLDESLNAAAFDEEGFFRTGDLGVVDAEGFVTITGRLKDVIIRKGENISAKEVEDLLYQHPGIEDVAVIGLPDEKTGERACAVVALNDAGAGLDLPEIAAFLKQRGLMVQKIPEQLERVETIPRNPTGKILKNELRQRFGA